MTGTGAGEDDDEDEEEGEVEEGPEKMWMSWRRLIKKINELGKCDFKK